MIIAKLLLARRWRGESWSQPAVAIGLNCSRAQGLVAGDGLSGEFTRREICEYVQYIFTAKCIAALKRAVWI